MQKIIHQQEFSLIYYNTLIFIPILTKKNKNGLKCNTYLSSGVPLYLKQANVCCTLYYIKFQYYLHWNKLLKKFKTNLMFDIICIELYNRTNPKPISLFYYNFILDTYNNKNKHLIHRVYIKIIYSINFIINTLLFLE